MTINLHPASEMPKENRAIYFLATKDADGDEIFWTIGKAFRSFAMVSIDAAKDWRNFIAKFSANGERIIGWEYEHVLLGEPEPECEDCCGAGYWEKGLRGTRMECETCHGSGLANRPAEQGTYRAKQIDAAELACGDR